MRFTLGLITLRHARLTRIRLQTAIYFCLHRWSLPGNTEQRQRQFRGKTCAQNFRKKLYVRKNHARGTGRGLGVGVGLGTSGGVGRIPLERNVQVKSVGGPQSNAPAGICMVLRPVTTGDVLK